MDNKQLKFKTNINCGGCVAKVQDQLDGAAGLGDWHVDTAHEDKILTVTSAGITEDEVVALIRKRGFKAEPVAAEA